MICNICGSKKNMRYCNKCKFKTSTAFSKKFIENVSLNDRLRNFMKSEEKINGKSKKEIEQYVGNKDKDIISEFERIRNNNKKTRVIHRLWRRFGNIFKKVHEHEK